MKIRDSDNGHALRDDDSHEYPLVAIDSYTKDYRPLRQLFDDAYFEMRENLWEFRLHEHITPVLSDTVLYLQHFWRSPLRLAFIDASHHYEPTKAELALTVNRIVPGGWLVLDDYFDSETPEVKQAVDECLDARDTEGWEFYRCEGLAIIRIG